MTTYPPTQSDDSGKESSTNLGYSRLMGLHTWSDHLPAVNLTNSIYSMISGDRNSKVRHRLLRIVLLELYLIWQTDPDLKLAVLRDNNAYPKSRYNGLEVSKTVILVVDMLHKAGLIYKANGFWDRLSQNGFCSRIWPTQKLIALFSEAGLVSIEIHTHQYEESIILNQRNEDDPVDMENIDYEDTVDTKRTRFILRAYNALLGTTEICIPSLDETFIELAPDRFGNERRVYINEHDKFVRRVFNRGSFSKGGRFYGGWWQRCPKAIRRGIFINGESTVEIDFSGLMPTLLYAESGIDYWTDIGADPYILDNLPESLAKLATRELCKDILIAAINAESDKKAYQGIRGGAEPRSATKSMTLKSFTAILSLLRQKHHAIAHKFGTGAGLDVMNTESRITERIISRLTRKGIPVLTIHDSYIVPESHKFTLMEQMRRAFAEVTGVEGIRVSL